MDEWSLGAKIHSQLATELAELQIHFVRSVFLFSQLNSRCFSWLVISLHHDLVFSTFSGFFYLYQIVFLSSRCWWPFSGLSLLYCLIFIDLWFRSHGHGHVTLVPHQSSLKMMMFSSRWLKSDSFASFFVRWWQTQFGVSLHCVCLHIQQSSLDLRIFCKKIQVMTEIFWNSLNYQFLCKLCNVVT